MAPRHGLDIIRWFGISLPYAAGIGRRFAQVRIFTRREDNIPCSSGPGIQALQTPAHHVHILFINPDLVHLEVQSLGSAGLLRQPARCNSYSDWDVNAHCTSFHAMAEIFPYFPSMVAFRYADAVDGHSIGVIWLMSSCSKPFRKFSYECLQHIRCNGLIPDHCKVLFITKRRLSKYNKFLKQVQRTFNIS